MGGTGSLRSRLIQIALDLLLCQEQSGEKTQVICRRLTGTGRVANSVNQPALLVPAPGIRGGADDVTAEPLHFAAPGEWTRRANAVCFPFASLLIAPAILYLGPRPSPKLTRLSLGSFPYASPRSRHMQPFSPMVPRGSIDRGTTSTPTPARLKCASVHSIA